MEYLLDIIKIVLPSIIVFLTAYLVIRSYLENQEKNEWIKLKQQNTKQILPIRLQAYERIVLLLERLHPNNLVNRVRESDMTAADLQVALIKEIRGEYDHNLSQQLYLSDDVWILVKNAKEEMIKLINLCYGQVKPDDNAMVLSRVIINTAMKSENSPTDQAIKYVKQEAQQLF